jgi:septal ring factor EnvC (AmiA/AmiB activator)
MGKLARRALGLALCCLLAPRGVDAAGAGKDIEGIKRKIASEKQGLSQVQKREGSVLESLGQIENDLEKKNKELKTANNKLDAITREMARKQSEVEKILASIGQKRELLRRRAVALYRWTKGASPVTVLGGEATLGGFLQRARYLEVTIAFDRDLVERLGEEVERQETLRRELAHQQEELAGQRWTLSEAKESVRKEAEKKRQILASLRREKDTRARALKELEQAALRLQKMIDELSRKAAINKPQKPPAGAGLVVLRGKLEWPVRGAVTSAFGKSKHPEFAVEVFRKGIDIEAPLGQAIKVVEKGRVAFADRLTGYGRMVIVDHGERFFTVYAHLSEIFKKTGDEIGQGEVIGLVGDSDSLAGAKLYFEMRRDGRSIDPMPWLRQ